MADWDKAAEQIGETAAAMRLIEAKLDRVIETVGRMIEMTDRVIEMVERRPVVRSDEQQRRVALDLVKSRLLADTVSDVCELRGRQLDDGHRLFEMQRQLAEIERRLRALEERDRS
jgi:hypothetical protein